VTIDKCSARTQHGSVPLGKLLVVDDEANARRALAEILATEGYEVRTARDGQAALDVASEFSPELVVSDLRMPGMSGLELLTELSAQHPDVGVMLMTAFAEIETAVQAIRQGAADYVIKPLDADALLLTIENNLARYRLRREVRRLQERLDEPRER
jgi:DNA-binding NtrC family response regulator